MFRDRELNESARRYAKGHYFEELGYRASPLTGAEALRLRAAKGVLAGAGVAVDFPIMKTEELELVEHGHHNGIGYLSPGFLAETEKKSRWYVEERWTPEEQRERFVFVLLELVAEIRDRRMDLLVGGALITLGETAELAEPLLAPAAEENNAELL